VRRLLEDPQVEILPEDGVEDVVAECLPEGTLVRVACIPDEGSDRSVEVACRISTRGYRAIPHITARTVRDRHHLEALLAKMRAAGVRRGFFPGGDNKAAVGQYSSAVELLDDLAGIDHQLVEVGIAGYPEEHKFIPTPVVLEGLRRKQEVATSLSSELCFNPDQIVTWLRGLRAAGIALPVHIGIAGVVPVRRLAAALRDFGLRTGVAYLRKQHGLMRTLLRGNFAPDNALNGLSSYLDDPDLGELRGFYLVTLQSIGPTETWRQQRLSPTDHD
jgi:methylenetetrahydrofolate reductase (NADPH)